ncbi:manganese-dependent ADP-ribose/CDP-alcohol diphosphatase-like [Pelodytes ibericus]
MMDQDHHRSQRDQQPYFTFGIIADVQYADQPDRLSGWKTMRYYSQSCLHLRNAIDEWKKEDMLPKFVLQLGDIIDASNRHSSTSEKSLQVILKEVQNINVPFHHIWGNHELYNFNRNFLRESALNTTCLANSRLEETSEYCTSGLDYYAYHFSPFSNFRCIVVDSYDLSIYGRELTDPKHQESTAFLENKFQNNESRSDFLEPQLRDFNGGFSTDQLSWLNKVLTFSDEHKERVIIAGHGPVHPKAALKSCLAWNYKAMLTLIQSHSSVVCYMAGHDHNGGYHKDSHGIYHITMEGVIESPPGTNAFATAYVYKDRMVLNGRGRVKSRILHYRK